MDVGRGMRRVGGGGTDEVEGEWARGRLARWRRVGRWAWAGDSEGLGWVMITMLMCLWAPLWGLIVSLLGLSLGFASSALAWEDVISAVEGAVFAA